MGCSELSHPGQPPIMVPVGAAASSEPRCKAHPWHLLQPDAEAIHM